jgi:hypothetical protein
MRTGLKYSLFTIALSVAFAGAAQAEDHWVKDPDTDCMIWSPDPIEPDTKVSWSGACQGTGKGGPAYGVGKLVWTEGGVEIGVYEGGLSLGKLSNSGELKIREKAGDKFTVARGVFAEGALNGYGEVDSPDGGTYRGGFNDGKYEGEGVLVNAAGDRYEGQFKDGKPHGIGIYTGKDGEEYKGDYLTGKPDGLGIPVGARSGIYVGEFQDGVPSGSGMVEDKTTGRYHGQFAKGEPNGFGTYVGGDGTVYQGKFVNGLPDGTVLMTEAAGETKVQTWEDGKAVK